MRRDRTSTLLHAPFWSLFLLALAVCSASTQATAGGYTVLHRFKQYGGKGDFLFVQPVMDNFGYLFGITFNQAGSAKHVGSIFRLGPKSNVKVLLPGYYGSNLLLIEHDLYAAGVSTKGGDRGGIVSVSKDGSVSRTVHVFPGGGGDPGEIYDNAGTLVAGPGGAIFGLAFNDSNEDQARLFALKLNGEYSDIQTFPVGTFVLSMAASRDGSSIFGTTLQNSSNCGIASAAVFSYSPKLGMRTVFTFPNDSACGQYYVSGTDTAGNIYGYTNYFQQPQTLFELVKSADGYRFQQLYQLSLQGGFYIQSVTVTPDGSVVGTTSTDERVGAGASTGTLFRFAGGTLSILHKFMKPSEGLYPFGAHNSGPVVAPDGSIYGTTGYGGIAHCTYENRHIIDGCGTVYKYTP